MHSTPGIAAPILHSTAIITAASSSVAVPGGFVPPQHTSSCPLLCQALCTAAGAGSGAGAGIGRGPALAARAQAILR